MGRGIPNSPGEFPPDVKSIDFIGIFTNNGRKKAGIDAARFLSRERFLVPLRQYNQELSSQSHQPEYAH